MEKRKRDYTWKAFGRNAFWKTRVHKNNGTNATNCPACEKRRICGLCKKIYTLSTAFDENEFCSSTCETYADTMQNTVKMRSW